MKFNSSHRTQLIGRIKKAILFQIQMLICYDDSDLNLRQSLKSPQCFSTYLGKIIVQGIRMRDPKQLLPKYKITK